MTTICSKCGSALAADMRFCPQCGTLTFSHSSNSGASLYEPTSLTAPSKTPAQIPSTDYGSNPYGVPLQNPYEPLNPYETPLSPPPPLPSRRPKFGLLIGLVALILVLVSGGVFVFLIRVNLLNQTRHWYDGNYVYKKKITIDHTKVSGGSNLSNFPVLISMTDANLKTSSNGGNVQNSSGYDIIFVDSTETTKLDHEIEKYVAATGEIEMWVKIPTLSASSDTVIYMYFDNNSISSTQENKTGVWDSSYAGVWHFPNGTTLSANDSTANTNNGTINGVTATTGEIGGAASFNGTSSEISLGSTGIPSGNSNYTLEAWVKPSGGGTYGIIGWGNWGIDNSVTDLRLCGTACVYTSWWYNDSSASTTNLADGNWHHVLTKFDGTIRSIWVDGSQVASDAPTGHNASAANATIGVTIIKAIPGHPSEWFNGSIDEVRVSNIARSNGWITTEYNNQFSPSTFYTIGSATTLSSKATGIVLLETALRELLPNGSALPASRGAGFCNQSGETGTCKPCLPHHSA